MGGETEGRKAVCSPSTPLGLVDLPPCPRPAPALPHPRPMNAVTPVLKTGNRPCLLGQGSGPGQTFLSPAPDLGQWGGCVPWEASTCRKPERPGCPTLTVRRLQGPLSFPVLRLGDELQSRKLRQPPCTHPAGCSGQAPKGSSGPPNRALGRGRVSIEGCEVLSHGPRSPRSGRAALEVGLGWGHSLQERAGPPRDGRVSTFPMRGTEAQGGRRHRCVHAASTWKSALQTSCCGAGLRARLAADQSLQSLPSCALPTPTDRGTGENPPPPDCYPKSQARKCRSQLGGMAASPPHSPGSEPSPGGGSWAGP